MKKKILIAVLSLFTLAGCQILDDMSASWDRGAGDEIVVDKDKNLKRGDYNKLLDFGAAGKSYRSSENASSSQPALADFAKLPKPPKLGDEKLVSLSVTDDIPLKDVLIELSRLADVDMEIDSGIKGGITFRVKDKPFSFVIDRISDLADLRYNSEGGILRIERDTPYIENYNLDFLNIVRSSESTVNITTGLPASPVGGDSGASSSGDKALDSGSESTIKSNVEDDLWSSLEKGIQQILNFKPESRISSAFFSTDNQRVYFADEQLSEQEINQNLSSASSGGSQQGTFFILNKQAGVLTASATRKQHKQIDEFLKRVNTQSSAQVLIEAKIVEVTLNDQYQSGIDWNILAESTNFDFDFGSVTNANNKFALTTTNLGGIGLGGAVDLAKTFGTTRTLSSPRLHAMNNQQATLSFVENRVYFEIKKDISQGNVGTSVTSTTVENSTPKTIPIGIILSMLPSINVETEEVTMNIRPTLSRFIRNEADPVTTGNNVPVVEIRELDSLLKVKSGQVMVIGGLMQQVKTTEDSGVPGLSDIPFLGTAFKGENDGNEVTELVIFIRATVVNTSGNYHDADRDIYKKFIKDNRPLF